jgi:NodT family efflux transporter outer membrane factor (OMF) lipoprotein
MTGKRIRIREALAGLIAAGGLAGCMVGPNFAPPAPPKDQGYLSDELISQTAATNVLGGEAQRFVQDLDIPGQWWMIFESRPLDDLIEQALKANPDIQAAIATLKVAQQTARAQRAALFPTVTVAGTGSHNVASQLLSAPTADGTFVFGLFTALLNISYAVDVFGGVRRQAESLDAQAESQCFLLEAAYLTLASNVVVAAITEASLRAQLDATKRSIELQRQTLAFLQRQQVTGQLAVGDVATQQAALALAETLLPPLEKQLSQQRNLLATLIGQTTAHVPAATFELANLRLPQDLPVSLPSKMVEQRPDVRAAEASLHAAGALVGVAIANQLPQFNLGLSYGSQAVASNLLFLPGTFTSTVGGGFVQTLLDGGALLARRRAAEAGLQLAEAQYRSTVLTAFRNVADTLRALEQDALALRAAADAERAARLSLDITHRRLAAGDVGILGVLNAEITYQQSAIVLAQAQANRYADTAALYQALGGGWWNRDSNGGSAMSRRAVCRPPSMQAQRPAK